MNNSNSPARIIALAALVTVAVVVLIVALRFVGPVDVPRARRSRRAVSLNTGDVLAVAYDSPTARTVKFFTGSIWTHAAFVWRQAGGAVFVVEAAAYETLGRDPPLKGVLCLPFAEWCELNGDRPVALASHRGPRPHDSLVGALVARVRPARLNGRLWQWRTAMLGCEYRGSDGGVLAPLERRFFCSELVAHLLQELAILERRACPGAYSPADLLWGRAPAAAGHSFAPPVLLTDKTGEGREMGEE